jgi:hypothetical protein
VDWYKIYEKAKLEKGPTIDLVNDTEVLACWLFDIPTKMTDASKDVIGITTAINESKDKLQVIEDNVSLAINDEVDDKGKPKFSNQSIRDAEMRRRLTSDDEYLIEKGVLVCRYEDLGKAKANVEYWSIMFSAVKNEVYHRRRVEELDKVSEINKDKAKSFLTDEN